MNVLYTTNNFLAVKIMSGNISVVPAMSRDSGLCSSCQVLLKDDIKPLSIVRDSKT